MAMVKEAYVSFETGKLLKKKWFPQDIDNAFCILHYFKGSLYEIDGKVQECDEDVAIPTQQMAMRWLREVHKIDIVVMPTAVDDTLKPDIMIYPVCNGQYEWMCMRGDGTAAIFGYNINKCSCNSHEDACEAAIRYCLTELL